MKKINITIVGLGYVGYTLAVLLSKDHLVKAVDIDTEKVKKINNKLLPIDDKDLQNYQDINNINLLADTNLVTSIDKVEFVIIATPTDFDEEKKSFNTSSLDQTIDIISKNNSDACIIIKSTVPIGYTKKIQKKYSNLEIIFSPEFLREGKALSDNLYPSRIIIGSNSNNARKFSRILENVALIKTRTLFVTSDEAEAIKLFSNAYLAMRVAYFNEIDSFALLKGLSAKSLIEGISLDNRIGEFYNNPSFGYGGYCLPKDTKQLLNNYVEIPQEMIQAIIKSNLKRKNLIAEYIINLKPKSIGIYRLKMKVDSDNFRYSAILDIIKILINAKININIYEPLIKDKFFMKVRIENNLSNFKKTNSIIIANRITNEIDDIRDKVFTRDIYNIN